MPHAAGLLVRAQKTRRYLFLLQTDGRWNVPAGGIERGERPQAAALREFAEETGFHGRICVGARAAEIDGFWLYGAEVRDEFVPRLSEEHLDYAWTTLRGIPKPSHPSLALVIVEREA